MTAFAPLASTPLSAAPTGATLYLAAFESAETATWTYADIGNGRNGFSATGYVTSGTTTAGVPTSGSGNDTSAGITLSGLSASTSYKLWLVWSDGTSHSTVVSSGAFVTAGYTHPTLSAATPQYSNLTATSVQPRIVVTI